MAEEIRKLGTAPPPRQTALLQGPSIFAWLEGDGGVSVSTESFRFSLTGNE